MGKRRESKEGRLDHLLIGVSSILTQKLESKLALPGLAGGLAPILESEIKRVVKPNNVIPVKYRELTKVIGNHVMKISQVSQMSKASPASPPAPDEEVI